MGVDIVGQRSDLRRECVFIAGSAAVAMELDVGQVAAVTLEQLHGLERGRPVAGEAEVVGVNMHRVRQLQLVDRLGDRLDDLTRRHSEVVDQRVDGLDVAGRPALPHLDAAGIDDLGGVRLRRASKASRRVPSPFPAPRAGWTASGNGYCPSGYRSPCRCTGVSANSS